MVLQTFQNAQAPNVHGIVFSFCSERSDIQHILTEAGDCIRASALPEPWMGFG